MPEHLREHESVIRQLTDELFQNAIPFFLRGFEKSTQAKDAGSPDSGYNSREGDGCSAAPGQVSHDNDTALDAAALGLPESQRDHIVAVPIEAHKLVKMDHDYISLPLADATLNFWKEYLKKDMTRQMIPEGGFDFFYVDDMP